MIKEQGTNTEIVEDYKRYELLRVGQWILILIIFLLYTMIYLTSVVFDDFLRMKACTNMSLRLPIIMVGEVDKDAIQSVINDLFHPKLCEIVKNITDDMTLEDIEKMVKDLNPDEMSNGTQLPNIPDMPNVPQLPNIPDMPNVPQLPNIPEIPKIPEIPNRHYRKAPKYLQDPNCTETEIFEKLGRCIKLELSDASLVFLGIFTMFLIATVDIISRVIDEPINKFPMTILLLLSIFFSLTNAYVTITTKFSIFHPLLTSFVVLNAVLFGFFVTGFIKTFCGFCCPPKGKRRIAR